MRRLLAAGAEPSRRFHEQTIFYMAAWTGSLAAAEARLERLPKAEVDARSRMGWTPLFVEAGGAESRSRASDRLRIACRWWRSIVTLPG